MVPIAALSQIGIDGLSGTHLLMGKCCSSHHKCSPDRARKVWKKEIREIDNRPQLPDYDVLIHQKQDQEDNEDDEKHCYDDFATIPSDQYLV